MPPLVARGICSPPAGLARSLQGGAGRAGLAVRTHGRRRTAVAAVSNMSQHANVSVTVAIHVVNVLIGTVDVITTMIGHGHCLS